MIQAIGLGAGGHAEVLLEILRQRSDVNVTAILDSDPALEGRSLAGVTIAGSDEKLSDFKRKGVTHAFVGVGGFGDSTARIKIFARLLDEGLEILSMTHASAIISPSAIFGRGVIALAGCIVGCGAKIGDNVILNTGCQVDHHCIIGHHSHIAPGACLSGRIEIGEGVHIGVGASVCDGVKIGERAVVGAGAVVTRSLPGGAVYIGVPAHPLQTR